MKRSGLYIFFIIVFIPIMVLSEWKDISIKNRKEKIYSVDVKNKDLTIKESDFEILTDSIVAVGWSSTNGALFISNDGGRNWEVHEIQAFFPFAVEFFDNGNLFVCGYNYISDNAEANIFDLNGRQLESYAFDGENLPYLKNLFDCTEDSFKVLTTGYGGSVLLFDKEEHKWEQILVDPSKVFIKIRKFTFNTSQGVLTVGFLLGGKSFLLPEAVYFSNSPYKDWQMLYDFGRAYKGIEVIDFWFYDWDIENNFPFGFVIGLLDDTLAVFEANPNEQNFTKIYFEQTTSQPLGMYCSEINKSIIVPFDNGKLLKSENFGQTWHYEENNAKKQLLAVKFFKYWSESLLPEIFWNNVIILGFGSDGFITKYGMNLSLQVETSFPKRECDFDEIRVFDLLGREIGMFDRQNIDRWLNLQNSIDGIYLVVKFVNGIPCATSIYNFNKKFYREVRLF